jgi:hypothetical protein
MEFVFAGRSTTNAVRFRVNEALNESMESDPERTIFSSASAVSSARNSRVPPA